MLFDPRDSLNPRAFAVRHALLETLKLRLRDAPSAPHRERLARLARQIDVAFDATLHGFVVRGAGAGRVDVPVAEFRFYEPREPATAVPDGIRDDALEANRAKASAIIDTLLLHDGWDGSTSR